MALVLSLRAGQDVYFGDKRAVVAWIDTPFRFGIKVGDVTVPITDEGWCEIMPRVKVMAGIPRNQNQKSIVTLVIDAPDVVVLRGPLYRKEEKARRGTCETCKGSGVLRNEEMCKNCRGIGCPVCNQKGTVTITFLCSECGE